MADTWQLVIHIERQLTEDSLQHTPIQAKGPDVICSWKSLKEVFTEFSETIEHEPCQIQCLQKAKMYKTVVFWIIECLVCRREHIFNKFVLR